jgi:hypothetical protein
LWPWLRGFESGGVEEGRTTHCTVRAPLPYSLRFSVTVLRVEPARLIETEVGGDIAGPARLEMGPAPEGSTARLVWSVEVRDPVLRAGARLGRPLMEWGHEWVVANGVNQFRRRALPSA